MCRWGERGSSGEMAKVIFTKKRITYFWMFLLYIFSHICEIPHIKEYSIKHYHGNTQIAKDRKPSKYPLVGDLLNKYWYICLIERCAEVKVSELYTY